MQKLMDFTEMERKYSSGEDALELTIAKWSRIYEFLESAFTLEHFSEALQAILNDFYALSRKSSAVKDKTLQIIFGKIPSPTVRSLLRKVAADQGISAPDNVLDIMAKNSNGDLRAALRDLQAIGLGSTELREEQAMALDNRLTSHTMYELMGESFQGNSPRQAQMHMRDMQETPEFVMLWVDENLPIAYRDSEDLWRGYQLLARADLMLGRVSRRQYFGYRSYANDLISFGMCAAKSRPYRGFVLGRATVR